MNDYKRLTAKGFRANNTARVEDSEGMIEICALYNRLAELEDKIENGTLIEVGKPFIRQYQSIPPQDKYFICKAELLYLAPPMSKAEAEKKLEELKGGE